MNDKLIIYQILPRLWGDGRFDSCDGAFLSYLRSLGVDYLWLTGVPRHSSGRPFVKGDPGSPYAICDWYDVNPYLASNPDRRVEEFRELVARIHAAGLKCITDFIPNHVGCDYRGGLAIHDYCDGDWTDTLKVDWSQPRTVEEFIEVLRFWVSLGVDGFRCDMVELVPSDLLGHVIKSVKRDNPGLMFVAEVYGRDNYRRYLDEAGFDLLYDKSGAYDILRGILDGSRSAAELTYNWQWLGDMQPRMLNFLENHDEQRLASPFFAGSPDAAWAAAAYALLFNTASFMMYAGQETGEDAAGEAGGRTSIFNRVHPEGLVSLYDMLHGTAELPAERGRVLERYRELLELAGRPVFRSGSNWDLCYCNNASRGFNPHLHTAFVRFDAREAWLVFCNFNCGGAEAEVAVPEELRQAAGIALGSVSVVAPSRGYFIYRLS